MIEAYAHIEWCEWFEGCNSTLGLAHAHTKKKTKITTREEWMDIAKLCQVHHHFAEYGDKNNPGTHERMYRLIKKCIENRK